MYNVTHLDSNKESMKWRVILIVCAVYFWSEASGSSAVLNLTNSDSLKRNKRFLIFQDFGIREFVCGLSLPVEFNDKYRSMGALYILITSFPVPTKPIYWWDKWSGRSLVEAKEVYDKYGTYVPDESQVFIYSSIEIFINRSGRNGKKCLLRAICENALVDEAVGIWGQIIKLILTPNDKADDEFKDAFEAGRYGAACSTLFPECPLGQGILDGLTYTE